MKVLSAAGAKYFLNKLKAIFAPNSNFVKSGSEAKAGLVPSPGTTAGTTKYLREDGTWQVPPNSTYTNFVKSGSGAKAGLVPSPGTTAGTTKYLREDGTWQVPPDNNTTYSNMAAATASAAGKAGLVPAPAAGKQASFLRGDGTWQVPTNTTYSNFVGSGSNAKNGLVPSPGTTAGTTKYLREDGSWQVPPNATYSNFVKSGSGAKNGLVPAPPTTAGTTKYLREDGTWQVPPDNNTTYSAGTAALLTAGTDTANRVWQAKILKEYVKSIVSPSSSIAANGYVKLDSGLIIQWGTVTASGSYKFPIAFPTACYSCVKQLGGSGQYLDSTYADWYQVMNLTKTGFNVQGMNDFVKPHYFIAIGN